MFIVSDMDSTETNLFIPFVFLFLFCEHVCTHEHPTASLASSQVIFECPTSLRSPRRWCLPENSLDHSWRIRKRIGWIFLILGWMDWMDGFLLEMDFLIGLRLHGCMDFFLLIVTEHLGFFQCCESPLAIDQNVGMESEKKTFRENHTKIRLNY